MGRSLSRFADGEHGLFRIIKLAACAVLCMYVLPEPKLVQRVNKFLSVQPMMVMYRLQYQHQQLQHHRQHYQRQRQR